jgi:hypothetical protein
MAQRTAELEPSAALVGMLTALGEAGRYAGRGAWVSGRRAGRRARLVGAEAARRTGRAALALGGRQPAPRRRSKAGLMVIVVSATTAGAAAAVVARQAVERARRRNGREPEAESA